MRACLKLALRVQTRAADSVQVCCNKAGSAARTSLLCFVVSRI